jgi:hypothetical protein
MALGGGGVVTQLLTRCDAERDDVTRGTTTLHAAPITIVIKGANTIVTRVKYEMPTII